jgi:hypothetical protein
VPTAKIPATSDEYVLDQLSTCEEKLLKLLEELDEDIFFFIEILLKNKTPSPISYMAVSLIDKFSRKIINNIY